VTERTLLTRALVGLAIFTAMVALGVLLAAAAARTPGNPPPAQVTAAHSTAGGPAPERAPSALRPQRDPRAARRPFGSARRASL
jgi:hypothetical protein